MPGANSSRQIEGGLRNLRITTRIIRMNIRKYYKKHEAIERMADDCKAVDATVTPYKVDKVF